METLNVPSLNKKHGVNFDGVDADGFLIDDKGKYEFLLNNGWAQPDLLEQALRQVEAANEIGAKVRWHFAEEGAANMVRQMFKQNNIDIEVVHTPANF